MFLSVQKAANKFGRLVQPEQSIQRHSTTVFVKTTDCIHAPHCQALHFLKH